MHSQFVALAAAGALWAGCAAPATTTTVSLDNPANPAAASVPFIRPVNVLAIGETPATISPSTAMHMAGGGAMPGMRMAQAESPSGTTAATGVVNRVDGRQALGERHPPAHQGAWMAFHEHGFPVAPSIDLTAVKAGDRIGFQLGKPDADGNRRIERITRQTNGSGQPSQAMPGMAMPAQPQ